MRGEKMALENAKISPSHLKWIVIAVLGVTFMFIFKDELSDLIKDTEKVVITPKGVEIVTKTTQTPLGTTIVSGPPTLETVGSILQSSPYYQSHKGYSITWPQDGSWNSHPEFAQAFNADLVIAYNRSWGDYVPNVNVTIETSPTNSIGQYMEMSNRMLILMGFTVINVTVDEANRSGVRVTQGNLFGFEANQIQRVILDQGRAYIVTATRPLSLSADPKLWQDLNYILNSFRVDRQ